jgi:hypothetical protein
VFNFTNVGTVTSALYNQPSDLMLLGYTPGANESWVGHFDGGTWSTARLNLLPGDVGPINAAMPGLNGDAFACGATLIHFTPDGGNTNTINCGLATVGNWQGMTMGPTGDAWFVRGSGDLCHWTPGGFAGQQLGAPFTSSYLTGVSTSPDGGLWVVHYSSPSGLREKNGTVVDAGNGVWMEGLFRVGSQLYGRTQYYGDGLFTLDGGAWIRLSNVPVLAIWGEQPGDVWALGKGGSDPLLLHITPQGVVPYYSDAFPVLPTDAIFLTISGHGKRLVLMGNHANTADGLALEIYRP